MIYFDVTKTGHASHRSGLTRVSSRLRDALGSSARPAVFQGGRLGTPEGAPLHPAPADWFLTSELFSEEERPGFSAFLAAPPCRLAAIFHDAIPLKHPHITWPHSVARHPGYLKALARFDRVWGVSRASCEELLGFWRWQGVPAMPPVEPLALGADFLPGPAAPAAPAAARPSLVCVGILEPRKNQAFLLEVCDALWGSGLTFELHLVGRVNPHFGRPVLARLRELARRHGDRLRHHAAASDAGLAALFAAARACVFPTLAEGCGLPLLESVARGVPCVHSDLPVLRENSGGGCVPVPLDDHAAWAAALRRILTDDTHHAALAAAARSRRLPTWADTARALRAGLGGPASD